MHSLFVNDETNLLRLITPWFDNNCQIKPKRATGTFSQTFRELNTPPTAQLVYVGGAADHVGGAADRFYFSSPHVNRFLLTNFTASDSTAT